MKCRTCGQEIPHELSQLELEKEIHYAANQMSKWKTKLEELKGTRQPKERNNELNLNYILEALKNGGKTQAELSRVTFKSKSTISRNISKLEELGKVKKGKDNKYWYVVDAVAVAVVP